MSRGDAREPLRLLRDHLQEALTLVFADLDVVAEQCLRRAVDGCERRAKLVRDGGDELALELVERALLGQVPERVDDAVLERDAGDGEPDLAALDHEGERPGVGAPWSRDRGDGDGRTDSAPVRQDVVRALTEDGARRKPGDRRSRGVPVLDHARVVDEEDAVVHVLEHARVPLEREPLPLDLAVEPAHPDRALERGDEVVAVDRLRNEVVRTAAQRPDGEIVLAVAGDQERRRSGPHLPDLARGAARPSITGILMSVTIAS